MPFMLAKHKVTLMLNFQGLEGLCILNSWKKQARAVTRVVARETAVQTLDPAFTCPGGAAIGPALGGAHVDPTPIASLVVGADTIQAPTAHSPATCMLDPVLEQRLSPTEPFIEASRQLHASCAAWTRARSTSTPWRRLKVYSKHRPAPLTMQEALEEAKKELETAGVCLAPEGMHPRPLSMEPRVE
ncbi:hypothetical protein CB1_002519035 [Camelus ferus]|nr:hypothetical protein CB1_002519035 [Camelus ferus]